MKPLDEHNTKDWQEGDEKILMKYYDVDNLLNLVKVQDAHVQRLQAEVGRLKGKNEAIYGGFPKNYRCG